MKSKSIYIRMKFEVSDTNPINRNKTQNRYLNYKINVSKHLEGHLK
jgi:hypothetical protein